MRLPSQSRAMRTGVFALAVLALGAMAAPAAASRGLEAYASTWSYAVDQRATFEVSAPHGRLTVRLYRAGPENVRMRSASSMRGVPVDDARVASWHGGAGFAPLRVNIDYWPSGLYFARISKGRHVAFAPFVVRQSPFEHSRVAVVLPTNTWQAYNLRDDNGDGLSDSWYANDGVTSVRVHRPFLHHGVPPR